MTADELFVLLLLLVCVGTVIAINVHSRRSRPAESPPENPAPVAPEYDEAKRRQHTRG